MARSLESRLTANWPIAIAVFRIVFGLLFLCHGLSTIFGWPANHTVPIGEWPGYYAGLIELVTGLLITTGLFTRYAAFLASGEMAFAYFTVHLPHGFFPINNHGEASVMYCFAFLLLFFAGGGAHSLDDHHGRWPRQRRLRRR